MGRYVFKLPDVGEGTAEAEIVVWHVKTGDTIAEDQPLVDVMTDKATVEMTSPVTGTVLAVHGDVGAMAAVGSPLAEIDVEGHAEAAAPAPKVETKKAAKPSRSDNVAKPAGPDTAARPAGEKPKAAPAVRHRAQQLGIALESVPGSGPDGRITHADLDSFVAARRPETRSEPAPRFETVDGGEEIKIVGLRRKIAEKMQDSKRHIPHFGYVEEIDVTEIETLRNQLNGMRPSDQPKLTLLPFLIRAIVRTLPSYPRINARYDDAAGILHRYDAVHVGIATQTPQGLMVPVVSHAENRGLWDCAAEITRLAQAARDGKATREELSGSTITVTSLGPLGGLAATPIINHPEVAIIGPNKIVERPVGLGGQIVLRKMMNLSSSFDHRIVDGYDAADFVQKVKSLLEHPLILLMD
jgi:2-oxoisovalerate dehydrogenase E2 component (dihydrolipoyl transacylase)